MKILIIQHKSFLNGPGGTEKICSFLANNFAKSGHQVEIATNEDIIGKPVFPLENNVKVTNIFDPRVIQKKPYVYINYKGTNPIKWLFYKLRKKKEKFLNKILSMKMGGAESLFVFNLRQRSRAWKKFIDSARPDLIITMSISSVLEITYENTYAVPIINSVNGRPDYDYSDILWYRREFEMSLLRESYKKLSAIQILFESYKEFLPDEFTRISVSIPNPVRQMDKQDTVDHLKVKDRYKIVNVGSLVMECKQQHIAIEIFTMIADRYPQWDLHFWGRGADYEVLQRKVKNAGLSERVFFNGFTDNPLEELKKSDIFIFPSRYEGFPLALTEAMSVGLPCIGFEKCSGVNELILHLENGLLAKDKAQMLDYLEILMENDPFRQALGECAYMSVKQYEEKEVFKKWNTLISTYS
ncbi:glycosyltransferase [Chryseobacterium indologenes]|uniref:glycosyltransferase n=1 Tax=Chryseobacterium indologenes TaxID=253 RepID=UPI0021A8A837|nr:glycosyltransferase [Elizabethkingia anophelis]